MTSVRMHTAEDDEYSSDGGSHNDAQQLGGGGGRGDEGDDRELGRRESEEKGEHLSFAALSCPLSLPLPPC